MAPSQQIAIWDCDSLRLPDSGEPAIYCSASRRKLPHDQKSRVLVFDDGRRFAALMNCSSHLPGTTMETKRHLHTILWLTSLLACTVVAMAIGWRLGRQSGNSVKTENVRHGPIAVHRAALPAKGSWDGQVEYYSQVRETVALLENYGAQRTPPAWEALADQEAQWQKILQSFGRVTVPPPSAFDREILAYTKLSFYVACAGAMYVSYDEIRELRLDADLNRSHLALQLETGRWLKLQSLVSGCHGWIPLGP